MSKVSLLKMGVKSETSLNMGDKIPQGPSARTIYTMCWNIITAHNPCRMHYQLRTDTGGCGVNSGTPGFRCFYDNNHQLKFNISFVLDIYYILYQMI